MPRTEERQARAAGARRVAITVRGACAGPLRNVDLDLPLGALTCFAGPAGSGARTMAVEVLFAESHRRYRSALAPLERQRVRTAPAAEVEHIGGLPPAVLLRGSIEEQATVGDFLQTSSGFAELFLRYGEVACPACGGTCESFDVESAARRVVQQLSGRILVIAPLTLAAAATLASVLQILQQSGFTRLYLGDRVARIDELTAGDLASAQDQEHLFVVIDRVNVDRAVDDGGQRLREAVRTARAVGRGRSLFVQETSATLWLNQALTCRGCGLVYGDPDADDLNAAEPRGDFTPGHISLGPSSLADAAAMRIDEALDLCAGLLDSGPGEDDGRQAQDCRSQLQAQRVPLALAVSLDLGHLRLDQSLARLSAGESLRLIVANCASGGLVGVLYVCANPVSRLDPEAATRTLSLLRRLCDSGNTVLLVDNDPLVHEAADTVLFFDRGEIQQGPATDDDDTDSTRNAREPGNHPVSGLPDTLVVAERALQMEHLELSLPLGQITCVTGISGAGKTSLLRDVMRPAFSPSRGRKGAASVVRAGPSPIRRVLFIGEGGGKVDEGIVIEKLGLFGKVAGLFARTPVAQQRGYSAAWFQLARPGGRCPSCEGRGRVRHDMDFLEDIDLPCATCEGRRFRPEVLEVTWRGRSMADVMTMSAADAADYFERHDALARPLASACAFGLRDCRLGQEAADLDEPLALRVQLCAVAARASEKDLILLDNPAAGAHATDVRLLADLLASLVAKGATVVVAETRTQIAAGAARVLEMGPGRGEAGGRVIV